MNYKGPANINGCTNELDKYLKGKMLVLLTHRSWILMGFFGLFPS